MKALTIQQPWAACITSGKKLVENRSTSTRHRGPLAIHAGRTWSRSGAHDPRVFDVFRPFMMPHQIHRGYVESTDFPERFTFGAVIAVVELIDCHRVTGCCKPWGDPSAWHWVLRNVMLLPEPIPALGKQGLWNVDNLRVDAC